ncbi:MAG: hypothetical protein IJ053_01455 [Lachnospiraceae bacterium]|nr:hypothetical protein [Lachnospiraceae bacterium]MBR1815855.1 hypothetical protein [Lachnospiraceae bacterium]
MFRVWGRTVKRGHTIKEYTACIEDYTLNRTRKVYAALDEICQNLKLPKPYWLNLNQKDFIQFAKTRFTQDNFMDKIDFDYLEFQVIEEDY